MIEPKNSKYVDPIVTLLEEDETLIDFTHHGREDQIAISKELKEKVQAFVAKIDDEKVDIKELIRYCVREALELQESDIVIIKQDSIFIKIFDHTKKRQIAPSEVGTAASRYNGIDETELLNFYKEYFSEDNPKEFFISISKLFVQKHLIDEQIDNYHYEKYVFPYIQRIIAEQLEEIYDHNREFFIGFAGFIFRKHFKEVFSNIADLILSEIVIGNKYMVEFLKYYSLDIVIINGQKYKVPPLQTEDGLKWNVVSLHSVVKVYINTMHNIEELNQEMEELEEDILALYIGELSPLEYHEVFLREKKKLNDMIEINQKKLNRIYDAYELEQDEEKLMKMKSEIDRFKRTIEILRDKKIKLTSKALKKDILKSYMELEKEFEKMQRELKREQKILSQNKDAYISIKAALTKVLVSKKTRI
ncbi:MAG: hypothetical protein RBR54_00205 [Sulfurimonas sp.]|jgi:hypothetical protein|nr:hypothetical protein [Sulfurimonas sp.]